MPLFGPPKIENLKAKRDVNALVKALGNKDAQVREEAATALGEIRDARAVEALMAALGDPQRAVRQSAVVALGELGAVRAVEPLLNALQNQDLRQAVLHSLAKIAPQVGDAPIRAQTETALCGALGDRDRTVRRAAAEALEGLGWQPDRSASGAAYRIAKADWGHCAEMGAPALEPLVWVLEDPDWTVRMGAVQALGELGAGLEDTALATRAIGSIVVALGKDAHSHVRSTAASSLARIENPATVEPLIAALEDGAENVREAAATALGQMGDPQAIQPLLSMAKNWQTDKKGRQAAVRALARIGNPAMEGLATLLDEPFASDVVKEELLNVGAPAVNALIAALKSEKAQARRKAASILLDLYSSGRLTEEESRLILAQRPVIEHHVDTHTQHSSYDERNCHSDWQVHQDEGIGVAFPL